MFLNSVVLHLASCFPDDPKDGGDSERPLGGGLPKWIWVLFFTVDFPQNKCILNIIMIFWWPILSETF